MTTRRLAVLCLLCSGCFHIRVNEKTADAQHAEKLMTTPFTDSVIDQPCKDSGTGLETVRYTSNLGYAWLSVVTFGLVNLVDVEYSCAPQTGPKPSGPPH